MSFTITHDILGRVLSLDGPWSDDTLTWTYNDAARQVTRTVTGAEGSYSETTTADALGRLASVVNPLGTFTMAYSGNTSRAIGITHSGGFDTTFTYAGPEQGRALASILSKIPGGNTVARHSYTYHTSAKSPPGNARPHSPIPARPISMSGPSPTTIPAN